MSFSMMTIQPSISQDVKDNEEWERKKKKQASQMALARQREFPRGPSSTTPGGALGIGGIGEQMQQAAARGNGLAQPTRYPTPADVPKYDSLAGAKAGQLQAMNNLLSPGFGQGYFAKSNPKPKGAPAAPAVIAPAATSDKAIADAADPLYNTSTDAISAEQGGKSYGLSITPGPDRANAAQDFAAAVKGGAGDMQGFNIPGAPKRGMQGIKEREALIKQASTVQAGARGITAAQMNVLAGLQNNDDKFANDQYQAQLGAASNMAQSQVRETNANARAALGEMSAGERQNQQLGFDAEKFQQTTGLDSRRLDIAEADSNTKNFSTKERNKLYQEWERAETDEDKSAILSKMATLSGTGGGEKWKAIKGAQTIENGLPIDGAPLLLEEGSGRTKGIDAQPVAEFDMNDPGTAKIMSNPNTSFEQKMAEYGAYLQAKNGQ